MTDVSHWVYQFAFGFPRDCQSDNAEVRMLHCKHLLPTTASQNVKRVQGLPCCLLRAWCRADVSLRSIWSPWKHGNNIPLSLLRVEIIFCYIYWEWKSYSAIRDVHTSNFTIHKLCTCLNPLRATVMASQSWYSATCWANRKAVNLLLNFENSYRFCKLAYRLADFSFTAQIQTDLLILPVSIETKHTHVNTGKQQVKEWSVWK